MFLGIPDIAETILGFWNKLVSLDSFEEHCSVDFESHPLELSLCPLSFRDEGKPDAVCDAFLLQIPLKNALESSLVQATAVCIFHREMKFENRTIT